MPEPYENREYQYYCPKCGNSHFIRYDSNQLCRVCNIRMIETPHEYELSLTKYDEIVKLGWKENKYILEQIKQRLFDEIISKSPEFDRYLYSHKKEILDKKEKEFNAVLSHGKAILENANNVPKCPYCQSTNLKKLDVIDRGVSFGLFGFASSKVGKQWHCNNCKSDF